MRINIKSITAVSGMITLFAIVIIYSLFNSQNIVKGVIFDIKTPTDGMSTDMNYLELDGIAKNAVKVSINSLPVPVDENGKFQETIVLSPGINNLIIKGEDKFGKEKSKEYKIFSKQSTYTLKDNSNDIAISSKENTETEVNNPEENKEEITDNSYKL